MVSGVCGAKFSGTANACRSLVLFSLLNNVVFLGVLNTSSAASNNAGCCVSGDVFIIATIASAKLSIVFASSGLRGMDATSICCSGACSAVSVLGGVLSRFVIAGGVFGGCGMLLKLAIAGSGSGSAVCAVSGVVASMTGSGSGSGNVGSGLWTGTEMACFSATVSGVAGFVTGVSSSSSTSAGIAVCSAINCLMCAVSCFLTICMPLETVCFIVWVIASWVMVVSFMLVISCLCWSVMVLMCCVSDWIVVSAGLWFLLFLLTVF